MVKDRFKGKTIYYWIIYGGYDQLRLLKYMHYYDFRYGSLGATDIKNAIFYFIR